MGRGRPFLFLNRFAPVREIMGDHEGRPWAVNAGEMCVRAMLALVIGMGVLMVAGVATGAVTIIHRTMGPAALTTDLVLDEPVGTHIAGISSAGDRLAVLLQGGGADRVVLVDAGHGRVAGRVLLRR